MIPCPSNCIANWYGQSDHNPVLHLCRSCLCAGLIVFLHGCEVLRKSQRPFYLVMEQVASRYVVEAFIVFQLKLWFYINNICS